MPIGDKFYWEEEDYDENEDLFLKQFDADGNFIELSDNSKEKEVKINYNFVRRTTLPYSLHKNTPQATETLEEAILPYIVVLLCINNFLELKEISFSFRPHYYCTPFF